MPFRLPSTASLTRLQVPPTTILITIGTRLYANVQVWGETAAWLHPLLKPLIGVPLPTGGGGGGGALGTNTSSYDGGLVAIASCCSVDPGHVAFMQLPLLKPAWLGT